MTEIIGHRGAPREFPENTLRAFAAAIDQGADAIELDLHISGDGKLVVHHDALVASSQRDATVSIAGTSWKLLSTLRLAQGDSLPLLDEVLELAGGRAAVYVEAKAPGLERELAACLDRHPQCTTAVHAFDHRIPLRVRAIRPGTPIGLLSASYPLDMAGFIGAASADVLWQHASLIDEPLLRDATRLGCRLIAWTENDPARARALIALGVSGICTDVPGALRKALEDGSG